MSKPAKRPAALAIGPASRGTSASRCWQALVVLAARPWPRVRAVPAGLRCRSGQAGVPGEESSPERPGRSGHAGNGSRSRREIAARGKRLDRGGRLRRRGRTADSGLPDRDDALDTPDTATGRRSGDGRRAGRRDAALPSSRATAATAATAAIAAVAGAGTAGLPGASGSVTENSGRGPAGSTRAVRLGRPPGPYEDSPASGDLPYGASPAYGD